MDRRLFVRCSAALAATAMLERNAVAVAAAGAGSAEDERLRALLDTFLNEVLNEQPESATLWGLDSGPHAARRSRLDDYSSQGPVHWLASCKSRLERLRRIDGAQLSANAQVDRAACAGGGHTRATAAGVSYAACGTAGDRAGAAGDPGWRPAGLCAAGATGRVAPRALLHQAPRHGDLAEAFAADPDPSRGLPRAPVAGSAPGRCKRNPAPASVEHRPPRLWPSVGAVL